MKKIKLIVLLMLCSLLLPLTVFAQQENTPSAQTASDAAPMRDTEDDTPPSVLPPETAPETSEPPIENKVTLAAQTELRAGEIAVFYLRLSGTNARAIQGSIQYDSAKMTLEECKTLASGWSLTFTAQDGNVDYLGLNTMGEGLNGQHDLISLTFRVSKEVPTDSGMTLTLTPPIVYDGVSEVTYEGDTPNFR